MSAPRSPAELELPPAPACPLCQHTRDALIYAGLLKPEDPKKAADPKLHPRGGATPQGPWVEALPTLRLDQPVTARRG